MLSRVTEMKLLSVEQALQWQRPAPSTVMGASHLLPLVCACLIGLTFIPTKDICMLRKLGGLMVKSSGEKWTKSGQKNLGRNISSEMGTLWPSNHSIKQASPGGVQSQNTAKRSEWMRVILCLGDFSWRFSWTWLRKSLLSHWICW